MKKIFAIMALLLATTVSACNTMEGLGEDIQKGGETITDSANTNR